MGNYSYHRLEIFDPIQQQIVPSEEKHVLIQKLYDDKELNPNGEAEYSIDLDGHTQDASKWYKSFEQLQKLSAEHPKLLFMLKVRSCDDENVVVSKYDVLTTFSSYLDYISIKTGVIQLRGFLSS